MGVAISTVAGCAAWGLLDGSGFDEPMGDVNLKWMAYVLYTWVIYGGFPEIGLPPNHLC